MHDDVLKPLGMTASRVTYEEGTDYARHVARRHDQNGKRIPDNPVTPQKGAEDITRYGAAAMLMTTPTDYATFLLQFLDPNPADAFRLNDASRAEMLRPQVKKTDTTWEGLAWHLEQIDGIPLLFSHTGQARRVLLPHVGMLGAAVGTDGDVERRQLRADPHEDARQPLESVARPPSDLAGLREAFLCLEREVRQKPDATTDCRLKTAD